MSKQVKYGTFADLVDVNMIQSVMMSGISLSTAISEFADNTFGEAAGNAQTLYVTDCFDGVVFTDQGAGIRKLQDFFVLGRSESRGHDGDIGSFGVGSKKGAFVFGLRIEVHTVREGKYATHTVDWAEVMHNPDRVPMYDGTTLPLGEAPRSIKNGGTMICITRPHKKTSQGIEECTGPIITRAALADLVGLFYPGLIAGRDVCLRKADKLSVAQVVGGKGGGYEFTSARQELLALEEKRGVGAFTSTHHEVSGKRFTVGYTVLPAGNSTLSGVHIDYGHRRVEHIVNSLYGLELHPRLYARVSLSPAWKHSLNDVKTHVTTDRSDMLSAVMEALREAANKLNEEKSQEKTVRLLTRIGQQLTDVLKGALRKAKEGTARKLDENGDEVSEVSLPGGGRGGNGGGGKHPKQPKRTSPNGDLVPESIDIKVVYLRGMSPDDTGRVIWPTGSSTIKVEVNPDVVPADENMLTAGLFLLSEHLAEQASLRSLVFGPDAENFRRASNVYAFISRQKAA